ncbi:hypothetical protein [Prescottella agglutinans]|uniref:Uncharacterized protein n=1 Tax=Prescottella agglutinans TaxID=1644129 RepID=A0ABT6MKR2_9NOCA|nr:hypothetical protein [Prescottella agglutinans]MDH6283929.1 hypothetical protein [Prescottella agglutinans]
MFTAHPNASAITQYAGAFSSDYLDHLLPKDPWFHLHAAYLTSAYELLEGFVHGDWPGARDAPDPIELRGAPDGVNLKVAVDLIGADTDEIALGGVAYLTIPGVGDLHLALPKATRDTDLFSAAHLYDPAAQISHVITSFCRQVDRALAPVDALYHRQAA